MPTDYRADQVGSLLRPAELLQARTEHAAGRLPLDDLRQVEDAAILEVLALQREVGLDVYTDGEYRRSGWMGDMADGVEGFAEGGYVLPQQSASGTPVGSIPRLVAGRLRARGRLTAHEQDFLTAQAPGRYKITFPSPMNFAYLCFEPGVTDRFYASPAELLVDLVQITRDELRAVVADGAPYVQLDAPRYTLHVDHRTRQQLRERGIDPDAALDESIAADNSCLQGLDRANLTVAMHLCRGNAAGGGWFAEGGYDAIAEKLFNGIDVDRFLLEFDGARAGGFEPLRFVPPDKMVVLGLVTTKSGQLESETDLLRRIDEASAFVPLERLAISPQCGFASVAAGNPLTRDEMRRKLELVVGVARQVWG